MLTQSFRRLAARLGIAALLFTQLAVALHACPVEAAGADHTHAAMADEQHAAMPCCDESDNDNTNLCAQHCQAGSQSVQTTPQFQPPAVAMLSVAIIEPALPACDNQIPALSTLLERQTSPPPLLRFCVLRI